MAFSRLNLFATYNIITNVDTLVHEGVAVALTIEGAVSLLEGDRLVFRPPLPGTFYALCVGLEKVPRPFPCGQPIPRTGKTYANIVFFSIKHRH